ncbi:MAG: hypothetical protein LBR53_08190 [Deltaproteobacteria bacterium]|jgi:flavodoxin|nr:hypothetical protein [Deltaproteobacteria bacterium]
MNTRSLMAALFSLPLILLLAASPSPAQSSPPAAPAPETAVAYEGKPDAFGRNLIVVFSLTGNTLKLAKTIQQKTGGDLYEIRTTTKYPTGDDLIPFAKDEMMEKKPVEFLPPEADFGPYDTIFFGTPAWFHDIPYPVDVYLSRTDFLGKRVVPFVTSGGGPGESVASLSAAIKNGMVDEALLISRYAAQPREDIENAVNSWLNKLSGAASPPEEAPLPAASDSPAPAGK